MHTHTHSFKFGKISSEVNKLNLKEYSKAFMIRYVVFSEYNKVVLIRKHTKIKYTKYGG